MPSVNTTGYLIPNTFKKRIFIDSSNYCSQGSYDNSPIFLSKLKEVFSVFSRTDSNSKYYKILHGFSAEESILPFRDTAARIRENFDDLLIVSMGGANLNPMSLLALRSKNTGTNIHFLNSTDEYNFSQKVSTLDPKKTAVLTISKSGGTTETISIFAALISWFEKSGINDLAGHLFYILGNNDNPLRKIAYEIGGSVFDHHDLIGGRFSGFTNVVTLPAMVAGLDVESFLDGANKVANSFIKERENSLTASFALESYLQTSKISVINSYCNRLASLTEWYCQIISESLGKGGKGITPIKGLGPQDQHSMMQLYLDGPADKSFTLLNVTNNLKNGHEIHPIAKPEYLIGKSLDEINKTEFNATFLALKNSKLPVRKIEIDQLDEKTIGALMMHFALEVITVGHLMEINPFDQPGVEKIKTEAKALLQG